jgi:hypothetical protein
MTVSRRFALGLILAVAASVSPHGAQAQARTSVSIEAALHAGSGKGGEFFDRDVVGARLGLSVRRWRNPTLGVFAEGSMDWLQLRSGHVTVCYLSSRGGCLGEYPEFAGPTAVVGLVARRMNRLEMRAGLGGAAYAPTNGPRVGAVVSQVDAAVFPIAHIGLVLGARWIVIPRYRGDRLSVIPWAFGMRVR